LTQEQWKICSKEKSATTKGKMMKAENPRDIDLVDGKPSAMGPITHMTKIAIDIRSHTELATF